MRTWELIDQELVPGDDGMMYLHRRGREYVLHVDGWQLMTNQEHGSEDALADLVCDRLGDLASARILVGGLGMGFTLAAALRRIGPRGRVTVAELLPAVVRWNRDYVGASARHPLRDRRTRVHVGSVTDQLRRTWSAVMLDIDNGPEDLTRQENGLLYDYEGLSEFWEALRPGGVLGIWSAEPDDGLTARLEHVGFEVEVHRHAEWGRSEPDEDDEHIIWTARRPAA